MDLVPMLCLSSYTVALTSEPLQGFDVKVIDVNRTCKVTKVSVRYLICYSWLSALQFCYLILHSTSQGGQIAKFTALLATGNYHGVVGFAKAKGPTAKIAIQRVRGLPQQTIVFVDKPFLPDISLVKLQYTAIDNLRLSLVNLISHASFQTRLLT